MLTKSLIVGDLHLGKGLKLGRQGIGSALNSRVIDQLNILEWILDRAIEFDVRNIIMTGDVFEDQKPHPMFISLFIQWLKKCVDNNLSVHVVVGNHDILRSGQFHMSALDIISAADIENIHIYKNTSTIHTNGASYTLLPFRDRRSFNIDTNSEAIKVLTNKVEYELSEIEDNQYKVLIGHLAIEGSIPVGDEIDDMMNELFCPLSMFNKYDYTWMGHIHKPQVFSKSPYISHIGSVDLSDFGESDHIKVLVLFDPNKSTPFEYLEIPTRPLKQISISVPENITDTTGFVVKELQTYEKLDRAIIKLNISLSNSNMLPIDRSIVESCLTNIGAFHVARINEEKKVALVKKDNSENIDNTVNEMTAIKMYAISNIVEEYRTQFVSLATEIVQEHNVDLKQ